MTQPDLLQFKRVRPRSFAVLACHALRTSQHSRRYMNDSEDKNKNRHRHDIPLGVTVLTIGARETLTNEDILTALSRHSRGDWGDLSASDREENELACTEGFRIFSTYRATDGTRFWVITEADRSSTTIMLPEEY